MRAVSQGPDGLIYLLTDARNGALLRMGAAPAECGAAATARGHEVVARVDAGDVTVRIEEQTAVLEGAVSSAAERRRAIDDARVRGVTAVNADKLVVDPARQRGAAKVDVPALKAKPDDALQAALQRSFENEPRLDDAEGNPAQREAAAEEQADRPRAHHHHLGHHLGHVGRHARLERLSAPLPSPLRAAYRLSVNEFNGLKNIQLNVEHFE